MDIREVKLDNDALDDLRRLARASIDQEILEDLRKTADKHKLLCLGCGMREGEGHQPDCPAAQGLPIMIVPKPLPPPLGRVHHLKFKYGH